MMGLGRRGGRRPLAGRRVGRLLVGMGMGGKGGEGGQEEDEDEDEDEDKVIDSCEITADSAAGTFRLLSPLYLSR